MKSQKRVIFVQGFGDYSDGVWPVWLGQELIKLGFTFDYLAMPDVMYPEVYEWLDFLKAQNIKVDQDTYFVAHSLGCITITRFLASLPIEQKAGGCIFVSGFCSMPNIPLLSKFCTLPLDFSEVKKHAEEFIVVYSDNDRLIPPEASLEFAQKLDARIIVEHGKGHFKSDIKELPCVLDSIINFYA